MNKNILLIGGPGSGKGTVAEYLITLGNYAHFSTGELLRHNVIHGTPIGLEIKEIMSSGGLVSDETSVAVMGLAVGHSSTKTSFIFDGFPRTLSQAPLLDELMDTYGLELDLVIFLDVDDDILMERLLNRSKDGVRVEDSDVEYNKKRVSVFRERTEPLVDFYKERGILYTVDGNQNIDEVREEILKILEL